MPHRSRRTAITIMSMLTACTRAPLHESSMRAETSSKPASQATIDADVDRVRAATRAFRVLDSAVAVGYIRDVPNCLSHPEHGTMGFHHRNPKLSDNKVELERPEILLYGRTEKGDHVLTGVEYIVPYRAHPRDAEPPTVMGQKLKQSEPLQLWYLHVWIWRDNPSGLFADYNPSVSC